MSRPQLALVLGGGGVRSVAALGIAEVLAEAGLHPGLVVGCSSGALFGACIAMGWSGREGLAAATSLWTADLTRKNRWRAYAELIAPKLAGFGAEFSLRDARLIRERIECAFGDTRFFELKIPLRIAATSLARDAQVVLTVGFRGALPRRVDRASRLVAQVTTTMINSLQSAHLRAAQAAGARMLHFDPDIDRRIGLWETDAMPRIFDIGCRAAREQLPAIRRMLDMPLAA